MDYGPYLHKTHVKTLQVICWCLGGYLDNARHSNYAMLMLVDVTFLKLICAWQSCPFAHFNIVSQPHVITYDKMMLVAHTSYITTADCGQHVESQQEHSTSVDYKWHNLFQPLLFVTQCLRSRGTGKNGTDHRNRPGLWDLALWILWNKLKKVAQMNMFIVSGFFFSFFKIAQ